MRSPRNTYLLGLVFAAALLLPLAAPTSAAPPAPAPVKSLPDYGGRDSALGSTLSSSGAQPPLNPLAQAGRAFEALVVVLACVVGGLYLLKRSGVLKGGPAGQPLSLPRAFRLSSHQAEADAPTELLSILGSQMLPQCPGAGLHLVSAGGRLLLLGATPQSVTLLTELDGLPQVQAEETPAEAAFADYLAQVGVSPTDVQRAPQASLAGATERLQSLLSRRSQAQADTREQFIP